MSAHMSLSVSVAVMGAIATYVSTGVIPDYYSVWIGLLHGQHFWPTIIA